MKKNFMFVGIGVLIGAILLIGARFITLKNDAVHHHANFALYINGQQEKFEGPGYYEEVQACDVHDEDDAHGRAHMHDSNNHLIHVHAHAVTWGAFFANLGYGLGTDSVETPKGVFVDGAEDNKLTFILNGEKVNSIANTVIKSEDALLIDYGSEKDGIKMERYKSIPKDAGQANSQKDPAACSGTEELTFWVRLKHSVGINQATH